MNSEWESFLEDSGACFAEGHICHFGNPTRELKVTTTGSVFSPLTQQAIICVDGDDAITFLQGQLTNDVTTVSPSASQLSGYCNPQGRLLALFRIFMQGDRYYLVMPTTLATETLKRLRMFVLMSKVTLEDISNEMATFGLSGPDSERELRDALGDIPRHIDQSIHRDGVTAIRVMGLQPRFEIYGDIDALKQLWMKLDVRGTPIGCHAWEYLDIQAGMPAIFPQTSGTFIPQMLNLEAINGLSFTKGCYSGQEIVARLQYRGKLKRHMHLVHIETEQTPEPGAALYTSAKTNDQAVGNIVRARPAPDGGCDALAVVSDEYAGNGVTHLDKDTGPTLIFIKPGHKPSETT